VRQVTELLAHAALVPLIWVYQCRPMLAEPQSPVQSRPAWALDAGVGAFAATTGALLVFARQRGGMFSPFAQVGRRFARDIALPYWGDATAGLVIHFGEALVLGACTAVLLGAGGARARVRAALLVVLLWEVAPLIAPLAAVRVDIAADLPVVERAGLAFVLLIALTLAPRRAT
jgi:hypothetical protein